MNLKLPKGHLFLENPRLCLRALELLPVEMRTHLMVHNSSMANMFSTVSNVINALTMWNITIPEWLSESARMERENLRVEDPVLYGNLFGARMEIVSKM